MFFFDLAHAGTFMPVQGTTTARHVDQLYEFFLWSSLVACIIMIGGMSYFIVKYRRKTIADKTAYITHDTRLEFIWSFFPFLLFIFVAVWGIWIYYGEMRSMPKDALEVHVFAKKWEWKFVYKNGREVVDTYNDANVKEPATMVVPYGKDVNLIMTSAEALDDKGKPTATPVIHSFFIPAFRIKQDVVPGRYSALHFKIEKPGLYQVFCTEYCGTKHSQMLAKIKAVSPKEFDAWLAEEKLEQSPSGGGGSLADLGKKVYQQSGCVACHSLDGSRVVGPTWKGLFGSKREFDDGTTATADENYIRESILAPVAHVVKGYPPGQMPVYKGVLTDEQLSQIIEFIKSLK